MGTTLRDPASNQLQEWYDKNKNNRELHCCTTDSAGIPLVKNVVSLTVGRDGPITLFDTAFFDQLPHFNRERIPERVVHAKGAGAHGFFEATADITDKTMLKVFEFVGKRTPIMVRFSQTASNLGSADTQRDIRGFAIKFYTEEGIWDLVGNNTPIFFFRDPKGFPMLIHAEKRNPVTNIQHDWNAYWDFFSHCPQAVQQLLFLYTDRGIPDGHRYMHGFGSHTFSFINKDQTITWVKFHHLSDQGIKNLPPELASKIAGEDPDYAIRDLYNAIARKDFPSWTTYIQTMTQEQAKTAKVNPFDLTKIWPHEDYPLQKVGRIVLDRNPANYFAEVEQLALCPTNMPPGVGPSPDRVLQGRLFSYTDTQRYRLGANYQQLPVNCPFRVLNFNRDGLGAIDNQGGRPNYYPNSFGGPQPDPTRKSWTSSYPTISAEMKYYNLEVYEPDNYSQATIFYRKTLKEPERTVLIDNLAGSIKHASPEVRARTVQLFTPVDEEFGRRLRAKVEEEAPAMEGK